MYYYINHLYGNLFSSKRKLSLESLYCETCGDYDEYLGYFETKEEAEKAYEKYINGDDYEDEEK